MSARYTDIVTFAYDREGKRYLVSREYFYAGGGSYRSRVDVGDEFYQVEDCVLCDEDSAKTEEGTYLPRLIGQDCQSYFSAAPTESIKFILRKAGLDCIAIARFLQMEIESVNAGPYIAVCERIEKDGVHTREYDLCREMPGAGVEAVIDALLKEYEAR